MPASQLSVHAKSSHCISDVRFKLITDSIPFFPDIFYLRLPLTFNFAPLKVDGQTRSFLAENVLQDSPAGRIELEFACRCKLRRKQSRLTTTGSHGNKSTVTSKIAVNGDGSGDDVAVSSDQNGEEMKDEVDEDKEHRDTEPEATAKVRLRAAGGELLGEAWADLHGAPDDWARYPLYSPGFVGVETRVEVSTLNKDKVARLAQGGVIPAPPATLRRGWGWGMTRRRDGSETGSRYVKPWFRPRRSRDVAGEIKLRLGWVPSGLVVVIHQWRGMELTATTTAGASDSARKPDRQGLGTNRRQFSIFVRAEPGGESTNEHRIEVEMDSDGVKAVITTAKDLVLKREGTKHTSVPPNVVPGNRVPSSRQIMERPAISICEEYSETFFYSLDPACLLSGVDMGELVTGAGDADISVSCGGGARLVLSMTDFSSNAGGFQDREAEDCLGNGSGAALAIDGTGVLLARSCVARAEVLLFPGADPARRWVSLADPAGRAIGEIEISVAWAVAPVPPAQYFESDSESEMNGIVETDPATTETTAADAAGLSHDDIGLLSVNKNDYSGTAGAHGGGSKEENAEKEVKHAAEQGGRRDEREGKGGERGEGEAFPSPVQVVTRAFSMHTSDLVLRVSDLDVAVLMTMAKSIVRVCMRVFSAVAFRFETLEALWACILLVLCCSRWVLDPSLSEVKRHPHMAHANSLKL